MEVLIKNYNIFEFKNEHNKDEYIDKIFNSNDIINVYKFIRNSDILEILTLIEIKLKDYINNKIQSNNKINVIVNDLICKMKRLILLFNYLDYRNNNIITRFIEIFYMELFSESNKQIILDKIFNPIILDDNELIDKCFNSFISLLLLLPKINIQEIDNKKNIKYYIFDILKNEVIKNIKSDKSLNYNDLINDFKLINNILPYTNKIIMHSEIEYLYKVPIISILSKINLTDNKLIFDKNYYNIIKYLNLYNYNNELIIYIIKTVVYLENSIIITKEKYKNLNLFFEFVVLSEKIYNLYTISKNDVGENDLKSIIIKSINNIFNQDETFINYIVTSLIIFKNQFLNKPDITNKMIIYNISNIINISNKTSSFMKILFNSINKFFINDINDNIIDYINLILSNFNSTEINLINIHRFLDEVKINKKYNNDLKLVKINSNYPIDLNLCNIIICKESWKDNKKYNLIIPNEIKIYLETFNKFYKIRNNYKNIEWSLENSFIEIEFNEYTIIGNIFQISILFIIDKYKNDYNLISYLTTDKDTELLIKDYINILLSNDVILLNNGYKLNINKNIDLKNLKNKQAIKNMVSLVDYDYNNTIDCYIIKILKVLNEGLNFNDLLDSINTKNKYFKITNNLLKLRIDYLINKDYIHELNNNYIYSL